MEKITPWLWFDNDAEEAAGFYTSLFPNSRITDVTRYGSAGPLPEGAVMTVTFELDGREYVGLNAGPEYPHTPAFSLMVTCDDQAEVDRYWDALAEGGQEVACGWVTDRFGLSWQITPKRLMELLQDPDPAKASRAMAAMMQMVKIDIAAVEQAALAGV